MAPPPNRPSEGPTPSSMVNFGRTLIRLEMDPNVLIATYGKALRRPMASIIGEISSG
jgi:hypothetical protein